MSSGVVPETVLASELSAIEKKRQVGHWLYKWITGCKDRRLVDEIAI